MEPYVCVGEKSLNVLYQSTEPHYEKLQTLHKIFLLAAVPDRYQLLLKQISTGIAANVRWLCCRAGLLKTNLST